MKKILRIFIGLWLLTTASLSISQNTIGVTSIDDDWVSGYVLVAATDDSDVYLIDDCGQVVNQWTTDCSRTVANYLGPDGALYRSCQVAGYPVAGGLTGQIAKYSWDGDLLWTIQLADDRYHMHHDFQILADDRLLVIAYELYDSASWRALGGELSTEEQVYSEAILELAVSDTDDYEVVWEWHMADHLCQYVSDTLPHYLNPTDNPQRLDINVAIEGGRTDWLHINSVDYNQENQIVAFTAKTLGEVFFIDKSTTTEEAADSTGGIYGRGGDLLYRYGNDHNYLAMGGTEFQTLYNPHNVRWIDGYSISIFNNGPKVFSGGSSTVPILALPDLTETVETDLIGRLEQPFLSHVQSSIDGDPFYSTIMSGAKLLNEDVLLLTVSGQKMIAQVSIEGELLWHYQVPIRNGQPMEQGQNAANGGSVFNATHLSHDHEALVGKDLSPHTAIELSPDLSECSQLTYAEDVLQEELWIAQGNNTMTVKAADGIPLEVKLYGLSGILEAEKKGTSQIQLSTAELVSGIYVMSVLSTSSHHSQLVFVY